MKISKEKILKLSILLIFSFIVFLFSIVIDKISKKRSNTFINETGNKIIVKTVYTYKRSGYVDNSVIDSSILKFLNEIQNWEKADITALTKNKTLHSVLLFQNNKDILYCHITYSIETAYDIIEITYHKNNRPYSNSNIFVVENKELIKEMFKLMGLFDVDDYL